MCDSGVSIPLWSVIIAPPWSVIIGGNRVDKESRLCLRSTKNGMLHVPFGACYAQKEHAAFRSSWNRIAPRWDVCMDREISLETSIG